MSVPRITVLTVLAASLAVHAQVPRPSAPDPRTGLIVGQVVDADSGKPIRDAVVTIPSVSVDFLAIRRGEPPSYLRSQILTGADGRFLFRDLPKGSFGIVATKTGYSDGAYGRRRPGGPSQQLALAEAERVGDVVIRMWKHGAVSGTVADEIGEPLVGIEVVAFRRTIVSGLQRFVGAGGGGTDDRGIYRIANLSPGDYIIAIVSRAAAVPVAPTSQATGMNAGRMIPPPGTPYAIELDGIAYSLGRGTPTPPSPSGGRLHVYPQTFYSATDNASHAAIVALGSGEDRSGVDFQIRPAPTVRVTGTLLGPEGEVPAFALRLFRAEARDTGLHSEVLTATTDGRGRFTFPAVPEGRYLIEGGTITGGSRAGDPARTVLWAELPLQVGRDDIDGVVVSLQPGLRISGRFEFEGMLARPGRNLDSVPLSIQPADARPGLLMPNPVARADANGQFKTAGIPPGRYYVRVLGSPIGWMFKTATHGGRDVADVPLDLESGDVNGVVITFTDRWTGVRGTVTAPPGRSTDALVLLFPTDSQFWTNYGSTSRRIKSVQTSKSGEYVFNSVPVGSYYIVAVPDDQAGDWQDPNVLQALTGLATHVTINDGEKRVQNLRLTGAR